VSSTYYDLKHLRSSLENFIESLGFEPILSEKGDIAYAPDAPLDESCYRDAGNADIFVLIIGGRYGSEASNEDKKPDRSFFERYDSVTKLEFRHAQERNVPTYVLIDSNVFAEYHTFLKNRDREDLHYAYADSANIFLLIENILAQSKNNPMLSFERFSEIEAWLREQWAGLFKELLGRMASQQQLASLEQKVGELGEINTTLRRYLESIMVKAPPEESEELIKSEERRLQEIQQMARLRQNASMMFIAEELGLSLSTCVLALRQATSYTEFVDLLGPHAPDIGHHRQAAILNTIEHSAVVRRDYDNARRILGLPPLQRESSRSDVADT